MSLQNEDHFDQGPLAAAALLVESLLEILSAEAQKLLRKQVHLAGSIVATEACVCRLCPCERVVRHRRYRRSGRGSMIFHCPPRSKGCGGVCRGVTAGAWSEVGVGGPGGRWICCTLYAAITGLSYCMYGTGWFSPGRHNNLPCMYTCMVNHAVYQFQVTVSDLTDGGFPGHQRRGYILGELRLPKKGCTLVGSSVGFEALGCS